MAVCSLSTIIVCFKFKYKFRFLKVLVSTVIQHYDSIEDDWTLQIPSNESIHLFYALEFPLNPHLFSIISLFKHPPNKLRSRARLSRTRDWSRTPSGYTFSWNCCSTSSTRLRSSPTTPFWSTTRNWIWWSSTSSTTCWLSSLTPKSSSFSYISSPSPSTTPPKCSESTRSSSSTRPTWSSQWRPSSSTTPSRLWSSHSSSPSSTSRQSLLVDFSSHSLD